MNISRKFLKLVELKLIRWPDGHPKLVFWQLHSKVTKKLSSVTFHRKIFFMLKFENVFTLLCTRLSEKHIRSLAKTVKFTFTANKKLLLLLKVILKQFSSKKTAKLDIFQKLINSSFKDKFGTKISSNCRWTIFVKRFYFVLSKADHFWAPKHFQRSTKSKENFHTIFNRMCGNFIMFCQSLPLQKVKRS